MKRFMKKVAAAALCSAVAVCICLPLTACGGDSPEKLPYEEIGYQSDFLKAESGKIMNANGEEVLLRGVNAGGLLVTEHWMTGFLYNKTPSNDYRSLTQTFLGLYGEQKTKNLWAEYRANWWSKEDFKNCAEMGINVIRLPFTYMNVDFAAVTDYAHAGESYDFSVLDEFVDTAAKYGMYTILDMHGAYGSQNGQDHSGQIIAEAKDVDFYSNEQYLSLTEKLWAALSEHFKDNAAVAGYDLLNERGEKAGLTTTRHWNYFNRLYKAIRATGDEHVVIIESCWDGANLPQPSAYGWQNVMYSFHHYVGETNAGKPITEEEHLTSFKNKLAEIEKRNFGVPLYMGEFTCYNSAKKWEDTLALMNEHGWHWTSWTYKIFPKKETGRTAWGVINVLTDDALRFDAAQDAYETLLSKFKNLRTGGNYAEMYTFYVQNDEGERTPYKTLEEIFKEYCAQSKKGD